MLTYSLLITGKEAMVKKILIQTERNGAKKSIQTVPGASLSEILTANNIYISAACGGRGKCGKCVVLMKSGATPATPEDKKIFTPKQLAAGMRLSCLSVPESDCTVVIGTGDETDFEIISEYQTPANDTAADSRPESAYGIAIDIGTTTIAVNLVGMDSKKVLDTVTTINRQRAFGADVIARIQASVAGRGAELKKSVCEDLYRCIAAITSRNPVNPKSIRAVTIAGNTTMGHLLMGYSCKTLGVVPFTPVNIDTTRVTFAELFSVIPDADPAFGAIPVILLPGISTYVGADIAAGLLTCGFDKNEEICLLIDLGTNGEMAVGNSGRILCTSTAAGPAFEGGNITCGMGSVAGAICSVAIGGGDIRLTTIGNKPPIGLCGTGVIETTYELLKNELIDETGMLDEDYFDDGYILGKTPDGKDIFFSQKDIREIQLAKSAVRAGVETLLLRYGITYDDIAHVYLAGGFGYRIDLHKAVGIGMLPSELEDRITAVGNSSLGGATHYLTDPEAPARIQSIVDVCTEISLSTDKDFMQLYTEHMFFE